MENDIKTVSGNIIDVFNSEIYPGTLWISDGKIVDIIHENENFPVYIMPGFIDSHVHIESSMLTPSEFGRIAAVHGTVAVVSDPHEIANVLGVYGVRYMIDDAANVPVKFYFGAPSCVPATDFETSGAVIGPEEIEVLMKMARIRYLAEVMNFPGVIYGDPGIIQKINIAKKYSKKIDGHAPGLMGKDLEKYVQAGISTDHECLSKEEAIEKIRLGMKILIREGSAARNFDELIPIAEDYPESCMFCSDDKHPDDLIKGQLNILVNRALAYGIDIMKVLRVACVNPVFHYGLDTGLLRIGDSADFIVTDNIRDFNVLETYINGELIAEKGKPCIPRANPKIVNNFHVKEKNVDEFLIPYIKGNINVIEAIDGQLITNKLVLKPKVADGYAVSDRDRDILKIAVVNRYENSKPATGFIKNFGLNKGAVASSVAHDSHNVIAVGVTDRDICQAVNLIIKEQGGISLVSGKKEKILPLPVAGIMSNKDYAEVAEKYIRIHDMAIKFLGSKLHAPFMTLSFMALPVIPKLKLTDKGLFDGEKFRFIDLFE
jgi:adenine deaminase